VTGWAPAARTRIPAVVRAFEKRVKYIFINGLHVFLGFGAKRSRSRFAIFLLRLARAVLQSLSTSGMVLQSLTETEKGIEDEKEQNGSGFYPR